MKRRKKLLIYDRRSELKKILGKNTKTASFKLTIWCTKREQQKDDRFHGLIVLKLCHSTWSHNFWCFNRFIAEQSKKWLIVSKYSRSYLDSFKATAYEFGNVLLWSKRFGYLNIIFWKFSMHNTDLVSSSTQNCQLQNSPIKYSAN